MERRRDRPPARPRRPHRHAVTGAAGRDPAPVRDPRRHRGHPHPGRSAGAADRGARPGGSATAVRHRRSHARPGSACGAGPADPAEQRLVRTCASAVAELVGEPGDRLLHWDLHYDNVLAGTREPWLAIDPEPLAGDPGFDLLPTLDSRWDEVTATGDVARAVLRRFDLLTEVLGLDRNRATGWTLGRVLQNALWDVEGGKAALEPVQVAIATALLRHR
nr:aminoglycoside phosphotransferase family protein [Amycolatopsis viridis]